MERSKRKSPAKRRFPVPVSPGKMGTICKGDFRLDRSIPRSPGSPRPRQDALEHIHAPRSVARSVLSSQKKSSLQFAYVARCTGNILCQHQQYSTAVAGTTHILWSEAFILWLPGLQYTVIRV